MSLADRLFGIRGKAALITGGYSGLGKAISLGLAEMGARIAVAGIEGAQAAEFADGLRSKGYDAYAVTFDVTSTADTRQMVARVPDHFGRLDLLVNSVGVSREQKADEVTEDVWDNVVDINLK